YSAVKLAPSSRAVGCRETPVLPDGLWRSDPGAVGRAAFPWIASSLALLAVTIAVRPRRFSPSPHSDAPASAGLEEWSSGRRRSRGPSFETRLRRSSGRGGGWTYAVAGA